MANSPVPKGVLGKDKLVFSHFYISKKNKNWVVFLTDPLSPPEFHRAMPALRRRPRPAPGAAVLDQPLLLPPLPSPSPQRTLPTLPYTQPAARPPSPSPQLAPPPSSSSSSAPHRPSIQPAPPTSQRAAAFRTPHSTRGCSPRTARCARHVLGR